MMLDVSILPPGWVNEAVDRASLCSELITLLNDNYALDHESIVDFCLRHEIKLCYKGDKAQFSPSSSLPKMRSGSLLLPFVNSEERREDFRYQILNNILVINDNWSSVPVSINEKFEIVCIQTGRKGKRGQDLQDMIWLHSPKFRGYVGLNPADFFAKFYIPVETLIDIQALHQSEMVEVARQDMNEISDWMKSVQEEGW